MERTRGTLFAIALALALFVGQQATALHDLRHAVERIASHGDSLPGPSHACDQCFYCDGMSGAMGTAALEAPAIRVVEEPALAIESAQRTTAACLAFRSRAPPASA
jgi:hypothetical protein